MTDLQQTLDLYMRVQDRVKDSAIHPVYSPEVVSGAVWRTIIGHCLRWHEGKENYQLSSTRESPKAMMWLLARMNDGQMEMKYHFEWSGYGWIGSIGPFESVQTLLSDVVADLFAKTTEVPE